MKKHINVPKNIRIRLYLMLAFVKRRPHCFHNSLVVLNSVLHTLIIFECESHLKHMDTKGCIKQASRLFQFTPEIWPRSIKGSNLISAGRS